MNSGENIKILALNISMLMITFTHLDIILKTALVVVTLGFTIDKWVSHRIDRKEKNKNKDEKDNRGED